MEKLSDNIDTTEFENLQNRYQELGQKIVQAAPVLYIDADVESYGIAGYGSLLSVVFVTPVGNAFYREIKPLDDNFIPGNREFCEAHGLERERLMDEGENLEVVMSDLYDWVKVQQKASDKKPVFTAFNAAFELGSY